MSDPFIAEIRIFAGNFAPRGWAECNGQLFQIAQNTALFSIVGTTYGGDGRTTLGLPDLRGRTAMHPGRGPGLTPRNLGQKVGTETVALTAAQLPQHTHQLRGAQEDATTTDPTNAALGIANESVYRMAGTSVAMASTALGDTGSNQAHDNMQPFLVLRYIIALVGTFPTRS